MRFGIVVADDDGSHDTDLVLRASLPDFRGLQLGLVYARLAFNGTENLFDSSRTVLAATARFSFTESFFVAGRVLNQWRLAHDRSVGGKAFATHFDWDVGLGLQLAL